LSLIEAYALTKIYRGGVRALDNLDLYYERLGSAVIFIGSNGAGKTTLFRILSGQLLPTSGVARVLGLDVVRDFRALARRIAYLPQDIRPPLYNLTPEDYVVTYLLMRGYSYGDARRRAGEILDLMELKSVARSPVSGLSGGMAKRAMLAMVLSAEDAEVFFLDEPLPGLDIRSRMIFWGFVRDSCREKRSFLISSHYLEEVPLIADHVVVISRGSKVVEGPPHELIRRVVGGYRSKVVIKGVNSKMLDRLRMMIDPSSKIVGVGDTAVIYESSPGSALDAALELGLKAEVAPLGLDDVILVLGVG
jgi:ABC-2 type transport system ATP-binding protein